MHRNVTKQPYNVTKAIFDVYDLIPFMWTVLNLRRKRGKRKKLAVSSELCTQSGNRTRTTFKVTGF